MLTPNSPVSRLRYVIKQYDGTKNQYILPDVIAITLYLVGQDGAAREIQAEEPNIFYYWRGYKQFSPDRYDPTFAYVNLIDWLKKRLPSSHEHDAVVPWIARELGRLWKAVRRSEATIGDYDLAVDELSRKAPAIAMWSKQEGVDLNRTSLADALDAVETFEIEVDEIPQGDVVYRFPDGFTIQDLQTEEALRVEGEINQHCVGDYCGAVEAGEARIYSLRDPKGVPKVTIEWRPWYRSDGWIELITTLGREGRAIFTDPKRFIDSEFTKHGQFVQIRGKQNDIPAPKYRPYIQAFIRAKFDSNPLGMLMVAMPGQQINFGGHLIRDVDFSDEVAFSNVPLDQAVWSSGEFIECRWPELNGANFDHAILGSCVIEGDLFDCSFVEADVNARFESTVIKDCVFDEASLQQAFFGSTGEVEVNRCTFSGSKFFNSGIGGAEIVNSDFVGTVFRYTSLQSLVFANCDLAGIEIDQHSYLEAVDLENVDLSEVSFDTVTRLLEASGNDPDIMIESALNDGVELPDGYEEHWELRVSANG